MGKTARQWQSYSPPAAWFCAHRPEIKQVDIYRSQRPCFLEFILTEVSLSPDSTCNLLQPNFTAASPSSLVLRGSGTAPYVLNPLSAAFSPIIGVKLN
jgi:hypothetical protein